MYVRSQENDFPSEIVEERKCPNTWSKHRFTSVGWELKPIPNFHLSAVSALTPPPSHAPPEPREQYQLDVTLRCHRTKTILSRRSASESRSPCFEIFLHVECRSPSLARSHERRARGETFCDIHHVSSTNKVGV